MEHGRDFLLAQVNNAIMQHRTLVENLEDHARQAEDVRYRSLCERYIPQVRTHQERLEGYGSEVGADGSAVKEAIGTVMGKARNVVDAVREDDFLRLVGDIVTIRQSQDTFHTFAVAGNAIGEPQLAEIGQHCEREHDQMQREFNDLANQMFIENVRDV